MKLPTIYTELEMQVVAKNDEHYNSMVTDPMFYEQMQERNKQANALQNHAKPELTAAGDNAAQNAEILVSNTNEHWINEKWRPAMGWMYMVVCIFDFIIFPIGWSILQASFAGSVVTPWQPITLHGAGLFHLAMGAVIGITSYGRTREKIEVGTK